VATDEFNEAYVVPLCDTFEHIKDQLSAETVSLVTAEDVSMFSSRLEPRYTALDEGYWSRQTSLGRAVISKSPSTSSGSEIGLVDLLLPMPTMPFPMAEKSAANTPHRPLLREFPDYISYKKPITPLPNANQDEVSASGFDSGYSTMHATPNQAQEYPESSCSSKLSSIKGSESPPSPVKAENGPSYMSLEQALVSKSKQKRGQRDP
jgi:hypothetical protein